MVAPGRNASIAHSIKRGVVRLDIQDRGPIFSIDEWHVNDPLAGIDPDQRNRGNADRVRPHGRAGGKGADSIRPLGVGALACDHTTIGFRVSQMAPEDDNGVAEPFQPLQCRAEGLIQLEGKCPVARMNPTDRTQLISWLRHASPARRCPRYASSPDAGPDH